MRSFRVLIVMLLFGVPAAHAGGGTHRYSVSISGSLTTSSKLFLNPNARDELIRGSFSPINSVFSFGADARRDLPALGLRIGLGAEYISRTIISAVPNSPNTIPIEDGYSAVPVELTGYFSIPVGGESFDFYMGGGGGIYFGERTYRYAGVDAVTLDRSIMPGIHVLTGLEYLVDGRFSMRTELKFRNVQLETVQKFPVFSTVYEGTTVPLPQDDFTSRIQIDGMHISLGLVYRIP
ncbi:MAG TPA: hypothetical protein VI932_12305 [Bacteroidota bacterium]|nr:hypothetical protein [Bacteroidota bacterium]